MSLVVLMLPEPLKSLLLRLKKLQKDQVQEQMQVLTLQ